MEVIMIAKRKFFSAKRVTGLAVLLALVIVLQLWGNNIKIGATGLSFVLVPIVLGGVLFGPSAGAFLGLMSDAEYRAFWAIYSQRQSRIKKNSGGSFYLTSVKRVGRKFAIHVRNAVNNKQLSYTEAYRLTGLYGKTYDNFMTNSI